MNGQWSTTEVIQKIQHFFIWKEKSSTEGSRQEKNDNVIFLAPETLKHNDSLYIHHIIISHKQDKTSIFKKSTIFELLLLKRYTLRFTRRQQRVGKNSNKFGRYKNRSQVSVLRMVSCRMGRSYLTSLNIGFLIKCRKDHLFSAP